MKGRSWSCYRVYTGAEPPGLYTHPALRLTLTPDQTQLRGTGVRQKEIEAEDVCPICQEELLGKRLPVSYCKSDHHVDYNVNTLTGPPLVYLLNAY